MSKNPERQNSSLSDTLHTPRFSLVPLGRWKAFRLSYKWTRDPELMLNLTRSSAPRSGWKWYRQMWSPNQRTKFCHAIIPAGTTTPIGMHAIRLSGYRSAIMYIAIHDRDWWEKGVVLEVRAKIMNHFFRNGNIERYYAEVNARNIASLFNYGKLGFKHIGTLHQANQDPVTKEVFDVCMFELFRTDWEKSSWSEMA